MSQFKIAIVGAGGISRAHIVAAQATHGNISIGAISADKSLNGVAICTPPSARIPLVKLAVERKLPVLMEKPIAHTLADAKILADIASKTPPLLAVGYCHRFTPAVLEIKNRIAAGQLGVVVRFENTFACDLSTKMKDHWMSDPKVSGGGSFIDTGCHSVDLYRFLLGDAKVKAAVFMKLWPGRGESNATVLLQSTSGVAGVIQSGWAEPLRFIVAIVGTKGTLSYDYMKEAELLWTPIEGAAQSITVETHAVRFQRQLEAFARQDRAALASFEDGLRTSELIDQAQKLAA
jgi:predicted dehydrogenase